MLNIKDQFLTLPPVMRWGYIKNVGDHFLPALNLNCLLQKLFPAISAKTVGDMIRESEQSSVFLEIMSKNHAINGALSRWKLIFLRAFVRLAEPEIFVETGVAHGSSSAVILDALEANKKGNLYSIDLPIVASKDGQLTSWLKGYSFRFEDISTVSTAEQVGWLVPKRFHSRWTLVLGDSLIELPRMANALRRMDVFLHDSLHLYDHMMKEFEIAWPLIPRGGFVLSDDIFLKKHSAVYDFAAAQGLKYQNYFQMGIVRKKSE